MKTTITFLAAILVSLSCLMAQTPIPGGNVNGTWTQDGSPYLIQGDITVLAGQTLTIEPGVEIDFQAYYRLDVYGSVMAVGTQTDSIIFSGSGPMGHNGIKIGTEESASDSILFVYCRIQDGNPSGPGDENCGGGIGILNFDKIRIEHCLFKDNKAVLGTYPAGGAIAVSGFSGIVRNCSFIDNTSHFGGAVMFAYDSDGLITHNYFEGNHAINEGGALLLWSDCSPLVSQNEFYGNTAVEYGGALSVYDTCAPLIEHNIFEDNEAGLWGGGVALWGFCNASIRWNEFSHNTAQNHGGGICVYSNSHPVIERNLFRQNNASYDGGGVEIYENSNPTLINNTFHDNTAGNHGGGVDVYDHSCPLLINNIIWNNSATYSDEVYVWDSLCQASFFNNDIRYGRDSLGSFYAQGTYKENIDADPDFVGGIPYNYHLNFTSPCIDAGHDTIIDPDGTVSDIGLYYVTQTGIGSWAIASAENLINIFVYPNPVGEQLNIRCKVQGTGYGDGRLSILDVRGVVLEMKNIEGLKPGENNLQYDVSHLPGGIYILRLQAGDEVIVSKVIKRR